MAEPPVYFAFTGGRQIGPLQFAEVADLAARGVLSPDDLAWKSGTPEWVPAHRLIAFPKRKTPSATREAFKPTAEAFPSKDFTDVPVPDAPAPARPVRLFSPFEAPAAVPAPSAPSAAPAASAEAALDPGSWKRVSLSTMSDDPGLSVADSAAAGDAAEETAATRETPVSRFLPALPEALAPARLGEAAILGSAVTWALVFFGLGPLLLAALADRVLPPLPALPADAQRDVDGAPFSIPNAGGPSSYRAHRIPKEDTTMLLWILLLILAIVIFGIGFFVRVLLWVGIALLIIWVIAYFASRTRSR